MITINHRKLKENSGNWNKKNDKKNIRYIWSRSLVPSSNPSPIQTIRPTLIHTPKPTSNPTLYPTFIPTLSISPILRDKETSIPIYSPTNNNKIKLRPAQNPHDANSISPTNSPTGVQTLEIGERSLHSVYALIICFDTLKTFFVDKELENTKLPTFTLIFFTNAERKELTRTIQLRLVEYTGQYIIDAFNDKYNNDIETTDIFDSVILSSPLINQAVSRTVQSQFTISFFGTATFRKNYTPSVIQNFNVIYEIFYDKTQIASLIEKLNESEDELLMQVYNVKLALPLPQHEFPETENERTDLDFDGDEAKGLHFDFTKVKISILIGVGAAVIATFLLIMVRVQKNMKASKRMEKIKEVDMKKIRRKKNISSDNTVTSNFSIRTGKLSMRMKKVFNQHSLEHDVLDESDARLVAISGKQNKKKVTSDKLSPSDMEKQIITGNR